MPKNNLIFLAVAASVLVVVGVSAAGNQATAEKPPRQTDRPNVVMIVIDDLNDWVEPLEGHPDTETPYITTLAVRGVTFENAHCQAPLCNPSRTSVLTGLRPTTTGIYGLEPWFRNVDPLKDLVTLPQYFAKNGYRTYAAGKVFHGEEARKSEPAEFEVWGPAASIGARPDAKLIPPTPNGNHPLMDWGSFPHRDDEKGDYQIAAWAAEQIAGMPDDKPFFMAVGFSLPHVPCYTTSQWFDLFPENELKMQQILENDREDIPDFAWNLHWSLPEPRLSWLQENKQLKSLTRSYLASIAFVDNQVGQVMRALDKSKHANNTIFVLWSDHGYHLGEKGITGKNSLWEPSTRVPLFIAGPGAKKYSKCDQPVELLDIYPTLIDLCGLPEKEGLEGISLRPQLENQYTSRERPAITTHNPGNHSVRDDDWRYIVYADGSQELYGMGTDPHEHFNQASRPDMKSHMEEMRAFVPKENAPHAPGSKHRVLWKEGEQWMWEGKPIVWGELQR
jgi:choline-sulfatase